MGSCGAWEGDCASWTRLGSWLASVFTRPCELGMGSHRITIFEARRTVLRRQSMPGRAYAVFLLKWHRWLAVNDYSRSILQKCVSSLDDVLSRPHQRTSWLASLLSFITLRFRVMLRLWSDMYMYEDKVRSTRVAPQPLANWASPSLYNPSTPSTSTHLILSIQR
jgi:hypothetical protein